MTKVEKISIALPAELVDTLKDAVNGGQYSSASEIVREALRDWKFKQLQRKEAIKEIRRLWREGMESGPGRFASVDELKAEARLQFEKRKQTAQ
ncbi:MAG: ribbon-helix-helix domain-containing protein [Hyphomicrobiales bacterium]